MPAGSPGPAARRYSRHRCPHAPCDFLERRDEFLHRRAARTLYEDDITWSQPVSDFAHEPLAVFGGFIRANGHYQVCGLTGLAFDSSVFEQRRFAQLEHL